jgi:hypothetical protein
MKQSFTILFLFGLLTSKMFAQSPCPTNGITTNPQSPSPLNSGFKTNDFNWMSPSLNASNNSNYVANSPLTNFFNYPNTFYQSFVLGTNSDYYPQDGWELIKRDFGKLADGNLNPARKPGPYMILYNKYTGKLRVVAAFPGLGAQQAINITLTVISTTANSSKSASAVLNFNNDIAQSMDQPSMVTQVTSPASYPGSDYNFFMADFQMAYDVCTCKFESAISVDFSTINTSTAQLYGRVLGTSNPNNLYSQSSTTFQLDQNQAYLTSVYDIPVGSNVKDIKAGLLTYKDINSLINDYKQSLPTNDFSLIDFFGSVLNLGIDIAEILNPETKVAKSIRLSAKLSDFYSSKIKSSGDPTYTPPSVIHAELSATGQITEIRAIGSNTIFLANPGSLNSNTKPEYNDGVAPRPVPPDVDYPIYNEALGTFAILETPFYKWKSSPIGTFPAPCNGSYPYFYDYNFKLSSPIKYVFNPALNLDLLKTKVYAAYVLEFNENNCQGYAPWNIEKTSSDGSKSTYISSFLPISDINNLGVAISSSGSPNRTFIRFLVQMVSNNLDKNGKQNQSILVATYEVPQANRIFTSEDLMINSNFYSRFLPKDAVLPPASINAASSSITVNGPLTFSGPSLQLTSPSIVISSGGVISSNTTLIARPNVDAGGSVPPQTQAYVSDFCDNTKPTFKYKGNTFARVEDVENLKQKNSDKSKNQDISFSAFPNPTTGKVSFHYYVEEPSQVRLNLVSTTGTVVATPVDAYQEVGPYEFAYDASNLPAGIYIYTLETSKGKETKRLVVIK